MSLLPWLLVPFVLVAGCGRLGYALLDGARLDGPARDDVDAGSRSLDGSDGTGDGEGDGAALEPDAGPATGAGDAGDDVDGGAVAPPFVSVPFSRACEAAQITVVEDGATTDDAAGAGMGAALTGGCLILSGTRSVSMDDPGVLDPATGRLLLGSDVVAVLAGGPAIHRAADYLNEFAAPIQNDRSTSQRYRLIERASGRVIVDVASSSLDARHDFLAIMVSFEPVSGTTALSAFGREQLGTVAATTWLADRALEVLGDDQSGWIVLEWSDDDGNSGPSSSDTFRVVESG